MSTEYLGWGELGVLRMITESLGLGVPSEHGVLTWVSMEYLAWVSTEYTEYVSTLSLRLCENGVDGLLTSKVSSRRI